MTLGFQDIEKAKMRFCAKIAKMGLLMYEVEDEDEGEAKVNVGVKGPYWC